jgi:transcriptional regulator with XRE-family HTH domain
MSHMQQLTQPKKPGRSIEEIVGEQIAAMRTMRELTQRDLASALTQAGMPVDASAVSRIEKGTRSVRLSEATVIASVLDVDLGFLMRGVLTSEQKFAEARRFADLARREALTPLLDFASSLLEAKRLIEENPALLATLEGGDRAAPGSASDYIPWVTERIKMLPVETSISDVIQSEEDAEQVLDLLLHWILAHMIGQPEPGLAELGEGEKAALVDEIRKGIAKQEYSRRSATARELKRSDLGSGQKRNEDRNGEHSEEG